MVTMFIVGSIDEDTVFKTQTRMEIGVSGYSFLLFPSRRASYVMLIVAGGDRMGAFD